MEEKGAVKWKNESLQATRQKAETDLNTQREKTEANTVKRESCICSETFITVNHYCKYQIGFALLLSFKHSKKNDWQVSLYGHIQKLSEEVLTSDLLLKLRKKVKHVTKK